MNRSSSSVIRTALATLFVAVWSGGICGQTDRAPAVVPCGENDVAGQPTLRRRQSRLDNATPQELNDDRKAIEKCKADSESESAKDAVKFEGLVSVNESDILKNIRQRRVQLPKDPISETDLIEKAAQSIREFLVARGYRHASVNTRVEQTNADSAALVFVVNEGPRPSIAEFRFQGNRIFSTPHLAEEARQCMVGFKRDSYDPEVFQYCMHKLDNFARSNGYLRARFHDPKVEETEAGLIVTLQVDEGILYRVGEIKIDGAALLPPDRIRAMIPLQRGEIANGERLSKWLYEELKALYAENGYIQYTAEVTPEFKSSPDGTEGIVDFKIDIDEGRSFKISRISFAGEDVPENQLRGLLLIHEGNIYNQALFEKSIERLNDFGLFELIDKDRDVDFRANDEEDFVDVTIKLKKKLRSS